MELIALLAACIFIGLSSGQDVQVHYGQTQSPSASAWVNAGWAASIVSIVVSCCCCLKRCFCKKSSKSSEEVAEPTENPLDLQQYMAEPRPPSYHREPIPPLNVGHAYAYHPADPGPSAVEMHGPASLPFTAHPAQMHSPASLPFTAPPAQAPATGGQGAAQDVSLASNFLSSETDPCFEMKGMNLPPPLYSECATADVYTSDKLNFSFL